jgi:hypothetical protein
MMSEESYRHDETEDKPATSRELRSGGESAPERTLPEKDRRHKVVARILDDALVYPLGYVEDWVVERGAE